MKSTKEDKAMLGKTRSLNILPVALFFAFAVYMMPGLAGDASRRKLLLSRCLLSRRLRKR